jgi:hypothetical protein
MTLKKLKELWTLTEVPGWNVQYIVCRWVDAVKNTTLTFKKWLSSVWKKDGDLPQDYTYPYSEMHGALDEHNNKMRNNSNQQQHVDMEKRVREAGL